MSALHHGLSVPGIVEIDRIDNGDADGAAYALTYCLKAESGKTSLGSPF